jgi:glycine cleavage system H protein
MIFAPAVVAALFRRFMEGWMSDIPDSLRYTAEHEYIRQTDVDNEFIVGITDYAQGELGDVVFVELPQPGDNFARMDVFGTIEAVKAVSDLFSPLSGEIVAVNEALNDDPALVNSDPYGEGWMVRIRARDMSELDGLLSATDYAPHTEG